MQRNYSDLENGLVTLCHADVCSFLGLSCMISSKKGLDLSQITVKLLMPCCWDPSSLTF